MSEITVGEPETAVPTGILLSRAALRRDLPSLLADRRLKGKWVCYHGERRVSLGADYHELIRECVRRGIPEDEYVIERVTPEAGSEEEQELDPRKG